MRSSIRKSVKSMDPSSVAIGQCRALTCERIKHTLTLTFTSIKCAQASVSSKKKKRCSGIHMTEVIRSSGLPLEKDELMMALFTSPSTNRAALLCSPHSFAMFITATAKWQGCCPIVVVLICFFVVLICTEALVTILLAMIYNSHQNKTTTIYILLK